MTSLPRSDLPAHHAIACTSGRVRPIRGIDMVYSQPVVPQLIFTGPEFNDRGLYGDQSVYRARGPLFDRHVESTWPRSAMQRHEHHARLAPVRCLVPPTARHRLSVGMRR